MNRYICGNLLVLTDGIREPVLEDIKQEGKQAEILNLQDTRLQTNASRSMSAVNNLQKSLLYQLHRLYCYVPVLTARFRCPKMTKKIIIIAALNRLSTLVGFLILNFESEFHKSEQTCLFFLNLTLNLKSEFDLKKKQNNFFALSPLET